MRVFVIEPDGAGGMIHYAYQLCDAMAEAGAEVTLITGRHYELAHLPHRFTVDPRMRLWKAVGDRVPDHLGFLVRMGRKVRRIWRGTRYALEWWRLTRHILSERPDVVQFAIIRFPFQAVFLRRLRRAGLTLAQICHEFEPREHGAGWRRMLRRFSGGIYENFDRIYLHGDSNREAFHRAYALAEGRTRSIPHGNEALLATVDHQPAPVQSGEPVALFFGGLRPSKGLGDLIDAWAEVVEEISARLLICGQPAGVVPEDLRRRARQLGVDGSVTIADGYVPLGEVAAVFASATVVVLPYRSATASGVLQLAYAFGRPVVATATGALAEDVVPGETGLLVEPGDISGLARALVKILSDPTEAARMGHAAGEAASRFAWGPIAGLILEDYRELAT